MVDAKINGVPGRFLIDTGAEAIFLTKDNLPGARPVKPFSTSESSGIGGSAKTEVDRIASLEIGEHPLERHRVFGRRLAG